MPAAASDIAVALVLVLGAWLLASAIIFGVFLATSYDQLADLALAALHGAVPAMWVVPAIYIATSPQWIVAVFGLILLANSIRLLFSTRPPRTVQPPAKRSARITALLEDTFARETLPVIGSALLLQVGVFAGTVAHRPGIAAASIGASAALITLAATWRGIRRQVSKARAGRTVLSTTLTLMLSTAMAVGYFRTPELRVKVDPSAPITPAATAKLVAPPTHRMTGKQLVPGVILRPERPQPQLPEVVLKPASRLGLWFSKPVTLPFTGDYHLFPTSSKHVQPDSTVLKGTPMDAAYVNVGGGPIETEALQPLHPPIDLTHCATVRLHIRSAELSPSSATVQLITANGAVKELGTEIFGFPPQPTETLDFQVAEEPGQLIVRAIRVIFHCDPMRRHETTKAAVQSFTFLPRVL